MSNFYTTERGDGEITGDCFCERCVLDMHPDIAKKNYYVLLTNKGDAHVCSLCGRERYPRINGINAVEDRRADGLMEAQELKEEMNRERKDR